MTQKHITRRLAAILAADMVGFSRLMGLDEVGTLEALKTIRRELIDPTIDSHHGRIVKTTGDGMLVEFASVIDAVSCAVTIQREMIVRNVGVAEEKQIIFRIGINVGDVIVDGEDIFGDGVNVAARLETLCEPGGLCISRSANDQIRDKLSLGFADLGEQTVKNISRSVGIFGLSADDIAVLPEYTLQEDQQQIEDAALKQPDSPAATQQISYCMAPDGAQIAYATVGSGPTLVKAPHWLSHLEHEWQSPIWKHLLEELASEHTLVRFDQRANGMSDWDVSEVSFDVFVADLETVVDTLELEKFSLLGISQGCAISIAYTVRHPERVNQLILYGGYARGRSKRGQAAKASAEALHTLIKQGWGLDNPAFRQMFTTSFIPEGTPAQMEWFTEMQRISSSAENAGRIWEANMNVDVTALLPQITIPTLVLHCRDDAIAPFEEGRRMAAMIPDAKFIPLEGKNHLILEHEPAWTQFLYEVRRFFHPSS